MDESHSEVLIRDVKGTIGTLVLNRPAKKNALSPELLAELHVVLKQWAEQDQIRVVVITGGAGTIFSAGYDIQAIPSGNGSATERVLKGENPLQLALSSLRHFPYPTIAMMNGDAFGAGLHLCMCCDVRMAADDIRVAMPPARLGVVYPPEGLSDFVSVVGMAMTREIFLTARTYGGRELPERGFVNQVFPRSDLSTATYALAADIAQRAPLSLKGIKSILGMLDGSGTLTDDRKRAADRLVAAAFDSEDAREAKRAFAEKRAPRFVGR
jgi:enoyl-CoA hydratase